MLISPFISATSPPSMLKPNIYSAGKRSSFSFAIVSEFPYCCFMPYSRAWTCPVLSPHFRHCPPMFQPLAGNSDRRAGHTTLRTILLVAGRGVLLFAATELLMPAVLGRRSDAQGQSQPLDEKRSKVRASGLAAGRDGRGDAFGCRTPARGGHCPQAAAEKCRSVCHSDKQRRRAHRRCEPDQVSGACRQSIERSCARLQADARRGPPACGAALLRCRFVGDARQRAGAGPALQFDRQCRRGSEMFWSPQFHDYLALCWRRQTFRSATDGMCCDSDYPLLQEFNGAPSKPDRRPFRSSTLAPVL